MIAFFAGRAGVPFALFGWLFHQLHLTYSAIVFTFIQLASKAGLLRSARSAQ